jgi:hypothetical protein
MSRPARQWTLEALRTECCEEVGECWEWQRSMKGPGGHQPQINVNGNPQNAARLAYALSKGLQSIAELPATQTVWRSCSNWRCINPEHLRIGSRKQQQKALAKAGVYKQDAAERLLKRGRNSSKLSMHAARRIRASTDPVKVIAAREGVTTSTVVSIRRGRTWREAPESKDPLSALAALWRVSPSTNEEEEAA